MQPERSSHLRRSSSYLRRVLDGSRSATVVIGPDGTLRYASAGAAALVGVVADEVIGASVFDWLHPDDLDRAVESILLAGEVGPMNYFPATYRLCDAGGRSVEVDVLAAHHLDDPELAGIVVNLWRTDERGQYVEPVHALARGASRGEVLELIAAGVGRGGAVLRPAFIASERHPASGRFEDVHSVRATTALVAAVAGALDTGLADLDRLEPLELRSLALGDLPPALRSVLSAQGYAGLRVGGIGVAGRIVGLLLSAEPVEVWAGGLWTPAMESHWSPLLDLATVAFERHVAHSRLVHAATHDPLTGLANRTHFFAQAERMMRRTDVAVLYVDLDGFKAVNDRFGHACGDEVLTAVAGRLRDAVRPGDLVGRLGGDEFAVAVAGSDPGLAAELAARLVEAVPVSLPGPPGDHPVGVSIGVSHRRPGQSVEELVSCADRALLTAKRQGRRRVVVA